MSFSSKVDCCSNHSFSSINPEMVPMPYLTCDLHGRIQKVNKAAANLMEWESASLVGENLSVFIPKDSQERHAFYLSQSLATENWKNISMQRVKAVTRQGNHVTLTINVDKHKEGFTVVMQPCEELQPQGNLHIHYPEVQKLYEVLNSPQPFGCGFVSFCVGGSKNPVDLRIGMITRSFCINVLEYEPEELIGTNPYEKLLDPEFREKAEEVNREIESKNGVCEVTTVLPWVSKSGKRRWIQFFGWSIPSSDQPEIFKGSILVKDITEKVNQENGIKNSKEFLQTTFYEVNNVNQAVLNIIQLLRDELSLLDVEGSEQKENVRRVSEHAEELLVELRKNSEIMKKVFEKSQKEKLQDNVKNTSGSSALSGLRILFADDSKTIRMSMKNLLKKNIPNSEVTILTNGKDVLEEVRAAHKKGSRDLFDLIIVDKQMAADIDSIENGDRMARRLRKMERKHHWSRTPVFLYTASVMDENLKNCLNEGVDYILFKPTKIDELLQAATKFALPLKNRRLKLSEK